MQAAGQNYFMNALPDEQAAVYLIDKNNPGECLAVTKAGMRSFTKAGLNPKTGKPIVKAGPVMKRGTDAFRKTIDTKIASSEAPLASKEFADINKLFQQTPEENRQAAEKASARHGETILSSLLCSIVKDRLADSPVMKFGNPESKVPLFLKETSALLMAAGGREVPHTAQFTKEDVKEVRHTASAYGIDLGKYMGAAERLTSITPVVKRAEPARSNISKALDIARNDNKAKGTGPEKNRTSMSISDIGDE